MYNVPLLNTEQMYMYMKVVFRYAEGTFETMRSCIKINLVQTLPQCKQFLSVGKLCTDPRTGQSYCQNGGKCFVSLHNN